VEGEPQPLSFKLCNLRSTADPDASSTSQHSELCLTRHVVFDKPDYFFAFGNPVPWYVLPGVCGSAADVLLLASGELRSALYSLTRDARQRLPVSFFVNDSDRHVLARNVVLLWLAHHAPAAHIFTIWFSLGLSASAHASLHRALDALAGPSCTDELAQISVDFWRPEDHRLISGVVREWKAMRLEWSRVQELRAAEFERFLNKNLAQIAADGVAGALFMLHDMSERGSYELKAKAKVELMEYLYTGTLIPPEEEQPSPPQMPNPTLFRSASAYAMHSAASPFTAFPHCATEYAGPRPLTAICLREMEAWVAELRARAGGVRWTFGCGDCLQLCAALAPRQFDVVATFDAADRVGLLPLLQAARLVTKQEGTLLTLTFLDISFCDDLTGYLKSNLFLEPALWPGVLGWRCIRCIGHEGALAPQSSQVQLDMISWNCRYTKTEECFLTWARAEPTNLPLDASQGEVPSLVRACRLSAVPLPLGFSFVPPAVVQKFDGNGLHLHSLLPVLAAATETDRLLKPADREMKDLLAYWRGELRRLVVASMPLSEAAVEATTKKQPNLAVLLETREHGTLLYSALWLSREAAEWRVCWLVDPDLLEGATAKLVGGTPVGRPLAHATHLQGEPCPELSAALVEGLRRLSVAGCPEVTRVEAGIGRHAGGGAPDRRVVAAIGGGRACQACLPWPWLLRPRPPIHAVERG
jgi:hypothetical protein